MDMKETDSAAGAAQHDGTRSTGGGRSSVTKNLQVGQHDDDSLRIKTQHPGSSTATRIKSGSSGPSTTCSKINREAGLCSSRSCPSRRRAEEELHVLVGGMTTKMKLEDGCVGRAFCTRIPLLAREAQQEAVELSHIPQEKVGHGLRIRNVPALRKNNDDACVDVVGCSSVSSSSFDDFSVDTNSPVVPSRRTRPACPRSGHLSSLSQDSLELQRKMRSKTKPESFPVTTSPDSSQEPSPSSPSKSFFRKNFVSKFLSTSSFFIIASITTTCTTFSSLAAPAAAPPPPPADALPYDLIMPQLRNLSQLDIDSGSGLGDISKSTCWVGQFTADACCREHNPVCWDEQMTMGECCPNADCWEGSYNYEFCCGGGEGGNPRCWGDVYNYARCCALTEPSTSWVDNLFNGQSTDSFYSFDEFYNDAQYGPDFGYYSTGRVMGAGKLAPDTNEFAHFTTFPMAIAPHFGRVLMRSVFLMWRQRKRLQDAQRKQDHQTLQLLEGAASNGGDDGHEIFQVVEMGAGSGQLGKDIRDCVVENCLGLSPELNKAWQSAFRYTILERSPALATRQRERGLEVIVSDAQTVKACDVLKSKAARSDFHADVVISNELIDAFAPVKLKLSVFDLDNVDPGKCSSWTEMKLLHLIKIQDVMGLFAQQLGISEPSRIVRDLQSFTDTFFCTAMETSVGQAAKEVVPRNTTCMTTVLALSALMETSNLQIPAASNNVRLRLRKDVVVQSNLRKLVRDLQKELDGFLAIPRNIYQELRRGLKERTRAQENLDVTFLIATKTKRLSVPISPDRCRSAGIGTFLGRHRERNKRLAKFYHDLGYPSLYVVMRPGEEEFLKLTDCVIGDKGGHVLTIDYGASYEPLANSLSVDPGYDGIFVPPIPHHLMEELPHCHGDWTVCAGRIDWTTFVDFTNMAAAGLELGYETVWYGPQCFLEQMGNQMVALDRATDESRLLANPQPRSEITPGYSTIENVDWVNRHAVNWYGPEKAEPWQQRWTGFKALLQRVPARDAETKKRSKEPSSGPASEALSLAAAARTPHAASVAVSKRRLSDPVEAAVQKHQKSLTIGAQIAGTKTIVGAKKAFAAAANNTNTSSAASTTESLTASQVSTTSSPTAAADAKAPGGKSPSTLNEVDPSTYFDVVPFPTWHLDSTEKDPCWLFDPTNMPIADWSRINRHETNATTRQVLSTLSVDVDRNLGERYAMGYEDAQLAVRLVDFLVKSQGCLAMAQPTSISLKWKPWMRQRWADVWRADTLDRVGPAVMSMLRLEASGAPRGRHYPFECMAAQTFRIMCADVLVPQEA